MKNAYYIDTYSTNFLHEMFDAASLVMFASMYDHIEYRTSRSSYEHVKALLGELPANVTVSYIPTINAYRGWKKFRFLIKQLQAILHNAWYILTIPKECDIIFNYCTLSALPPMNWLSSLCGNRILQICHGELTEMVQPFSKNVLLKKGLNVLRSPKIAIAPNLYFAVLGKSIFNNVAPLLSDSCRRKMLYFEHPMVCANDIEHSKRLSGKLVLGVYGEIRQSKGGNDLLELARALKDNPNVELRCFGHLALPEKEIREAGIVIPIKGKEHFLSRDEMYSQIRQLDYALFLLPAARYQFTASGTMIDAIACGVPILGLSNDYFNRIFELYGAFGYLEKDVDALRQRVDWLISQGDKRSGWDMYGVRIGLSPQHIAEQFKKQWQPE